MTDHSQETLPSQLANIPALIETPSDVGLGPPPVYDNSHSKRQDQSHKPVCDNSRAMAKETQVERTREAVRFTELIRQLEVDGISQSEMARRMEEVAPPGLTGIDKSYINHHKNETRKGIGTAIIRLVKDAFGIDPDYFFDDYEGVKDYKLYRLDERRVEKQLRDEKDARETENRELRELIATLAHRTERNEAELAKVQGKPPPAPIKLPVSLLQPGAPRKAPQR